MSVATNDLPSGAAHPFYTRLTQTLDKRLSGRQFAQTTLLLIVTFGAALAMTQAPSISGRVVDDSGEPLPGVVVTASAETGGDARRATSGRDGRYQFETLTDGTYRVDFALAGFNLTRRNHVRVRAQASADADATLSVRPVCECVNSVPKTGVRERAGLVVSETGLPLAHARVQIVSPGERVERSTTDGEGRFRVLLPINESLPLTASDGGFRAITQQVSGAVDTAIVFRLPRIVGAQLPATERLTEGCHCPGRFTHRGQ